MKATLFIDASILISILQEDDFLPKIVRNISGYENVYITPVSYLFAFEKSRKIGKNINSIHEELSLFNVTNVDENTIQKARDICKDTDFEDALQVASALENEILDFLTNDKRQAARYKDLLKTILL